MNPMNDWRLIPFDPEHPYSNMKDFQCGDKQIDRYLKRNLRQRLKRFLTQAFVLQSPKNDFVAFYTLESFAMARELFFQLYQSRNLPLQIPVTKIGFLGVDLRYQHRGIGRWLLRDAMLKSIEISKLSGSAGLYLLANEGKKTFYENLGFQVLREEIPTPMFLPMQDILNNLPQG
jgi:GNAT superfamily N-acetyltransferase